MEDRIFRWARQRTNEVTKLYGGVAKRQRD